jgi:hypothetical protein
MTLPPPNTAHQARQGGEDGEDAEVRTNLASVRDYSLGSVHPMTVRRHRLDPGRSTTVASSPAPRFGGRLLPTARSLDQ